MQSQMTSKICWEELCSRPCSSGCKSQALFTCCPQASCSQDQHVGCLQPNVVSVLVATSNSLPSNGVFDISNIYMHMGAAVRAARQDLNTQYGLLQMQFGLALADVHATSLGQHTVLHIDKHFHQSWWFTASLQSHQPAEGSAAYSNVSQIHGRLLVSNDLWQCSAQI